MKHLRLTRTATFAFAMAVAFVPTTSGAAQEKAIHTFKGKPGKSPYAGLVSDTAGNLYGTTRNGRCEDGCGLVFELVRGSGGSWTYRVLHVFKGGQEDGAEPDGGVILDANGNLYGTTASGGGKNSLCGHGCGTVFELSPSSGGWTESMIHRFQGTDGDGPESALVFDQSGNLYGTTAYGGSANCGSAGCGVVFELSPKSGGSWTERVLHSFSGADGSEPWASLIFDATGNLFGTTVNGGTSGGGVVFELSPSGGKWNQKVLYNFTGGSDGGYLVGKLTFDSVGNLYGTTVDGGDSRQCGTPGCGTAFKLTPGSGGSWTEGVLYSFSGGSDGASPAGGVVFDTTGNLYGVTFYGGSANCNGYGYGCGAVFELSPKSGQWTETTLYAFTGVPDGAVPSGDLIWDAAGNLYGTTIYGGNLNRGVVFRFTP